MCALWYEWEHGVTDLVSLVSVVTFENLDALILQEPVCLLCADKMKSRFCILFFRGAVERSFRFGSLTVLLRHTSLIWICTLPVNMAGIFCFSVVSIAPIV